MTRAHILTLSLLGLASIIFAAAPTRLPSRAPTRVPTRAPTIRPTIVPTAEPTFRPSYAPTFRPSTAPSSEPSRKPTTAPTRAPTTQPTRTPTLAPSTTAAPTVLPSNAELFAIVGGAQCAEYLHYGTATLTEAGSSDGYSYYMKTNPAEGYTAHTNWLQIVSDGSNELFRIYWTFSVARTLSDRFVSAVNGNGEAVSFRVVDTVNAAGNGAGYEFTYTGASWRFSDGAVMSATKFTTIGTYYGFSADDGCWGAGTGTLNANSATALPNFWGIANINSADSLCSNIYAQGSVYAFNANARSYMYIVPSGTSRPSKAPTGIPTTKPTSSPTLPNGPFELFAVVGSGACAEELAYGPATLTEAGSSDGNPMYFSTSTSSGQQPHTDWLQIVTTESSDEVFRIYWTFSTAKTLADRFVNAPTNGESVSYRVVDTAGVAGPAGTVYVYMGTWRFSDSAAITASKFTNTYTTWTGFSSDDGAWGAAPSYINANNYPSIPNFWGVGNLDNTDSGSCNNVYANGEVKYTTSKAFMYISTPSVTTSRAPTRSPAAVPGSTSTMSSKVVAFFSPVVITAIVVVVAALALLGLLSFCYRQYLCRCGQSPSTNGEGPVAAVVVGAYDLGDVEVQVVSGGEDGGAGSIEMMKMSFEQGGQDPSAPPMSVPQADMVAAAAAPPAAYFTVSEAVEAAPSEAMTAYGQI